MRNKTKTTEYYISILGFDLLGDYENCKMDQYDWQLP